MQLGDSLLDDSLLQRLQARARGRLLPEQIDPITWGLDMIDQPSLPLDAIYHYNSTGKRRRGPAAGTRPCHAVFGHDGFTGADCMQTVRKAPLHASRDMHT